MTTGDINIIIKMEAGMPHMIVEAKDTTTTKTEAVEVARGHQAEAAHILRTIPINQEAEEGTHRQINQ